MLVPEAIFFRIICHFKKVFTKLRSGSGVWGIKEKSKGVGVLQNGPSPDKHMGKLRFVQDWYRKNTVGGIQSARCDFPCNLPLDCSDPLHPGNLPVWKIQQEESTLCVFVWGGLVCFVLLFVVGCCWLLLAGIGGCWLLFGCCLVGWLVNTLNTCRNMLDLSDVGDKFL